MQAMPFYWRVRVFGTQGSAEMLDEGTLVLHKTGSKSQQTIDGANRATLSPLSDPLQHIDVAHGARAVATSFPRECLEIGKNGIDQSKILEHFLDLRHDRVVTFLGLNKLSARLLNVSTERGERAFHAADRGMRARKTRPGVLRQLFHFACHHGKPTSGFAGAGRFDGGV
jgi:hypothetical protein